MTDKITQIFPTHEIVEQHPTKVFVPSDGEGDESLEYQEKVSSVFLDHYAVDTFLKMTGDVRKQKRRLPLFNCYL